MCVPRNQYTEYINTGAQKARGRWEGEGAAAPPIFYMGGGGGGIAVGPPKMIGFKKIIKNYCEILVTASI